MSCFTLAGCGVESTTSTDTDGSSESSTIMYSGQITIGGAPTSGITIIYSMTGDAAVSDSSGHYSLGPVVQVDTAEFIIENGSFSIKTTVSVSSASESATVDFAVSSDMKTVSASIGQNPDASPTPTPGGSAFDNDANTTSFGIPAGLTGNVHKGKKVYFTLCTGCHPSIIGKRDSYPSMRRSLSKAPMSALKVDAQDTAHLVAYLNYIR